jgi:spore maturation protein CgeB
MDFVFIGLSLSSAWGNGHATTYRALLRALSERGHSVLFLECDVPWYRNNRDLDNPAYCELVFYDSLEDLKRWRARLAAAEAVVIGSYVPEGVAVGRWVRSIRRKPLAFYDIDTPITLAKLARGDREYLAPQQIAEYDIYFSFTGGPVLQQLERDYGSPAARALPCSADLRAHRRMETGRQWDLSYLGTFSEDRQPAVERLLLAVARSERKRKFAIAGSGFDTQHWPKNVEYIDHLPPAEHARFYSASAFTLNVTRTDMIRAGYSPSVRLFEAAACGTPVISDVWPGIETYFRPEHEITLAQSTDDVVAALQMEEGQRRTLGEAARLRAHRDHTPEKRCEVLEREFLAAYEPQSRPTAVRLGAAE